MGASYAQEGCCVECFTHHEGGYRYCDNVFYDDCGDTLTYRDRRYYFCDNQYESCAKPSDCTNTTMYLIIIISFVLLCCICICFASCHKKR